MSIDAELARCRKWIEDALAYGDGTHYYEDIVQGVHSLKYQLWTADRACLVTEILDFPRKRVLHVFLAGGELDQVLDMDASLIEFGRENNCEGLSLVGRKGWEKALKNLNWQKTHSVVTKDI